MKLTMMPKEYNITITLDNEDALTLYEALGYCRINLSAPGLPLVLQHLQADLRKVMTGEV